MSSINLDLQTLSFVLVLVTICLTSVIIFIWMTQKTYTGFELWVIANIAVAIGIFLLGLDKVWADLAGTSLTFSAVLIGYEGNRRFLNLKHTLLFSSVVLILQIAAQIYFKFLDDNNIILQVGFISFLVGVISGRCGIIFLRNASEKTNLCYRFTAATYIIFALIMFSRSIITFYTYDKVEFFKPNGIQPIFFFLYILFEIIWTFNYFNLNTNRLHNELKETQNELQKLATTDFLTGINNQRSFLASGKNEVQRAKRFRHSLSVIMFDIDFFKSVNDVYGHAAGDEVLIKITEICQKTLRVTDTFGRLGGEEFGILLPHTNIGDAKIVAEHLRVAIAETEIDILSNKINITASFGITELADGDTQIKSTIDRADIFLYEAKKMGRNRIIADPER